VTTPSSGKPTAINDLIRLTDKEAIFTGSAMGIGFAISYRLAETGAAVLIADVNAEAAQEAVKALKSCGQEANFIQCDVSQEDTVQRMVSTAVEKMDSIDILVNNAGIYPCIPLGETSATDFEQVISVNLKGAFLCSREISRWMIKQRQGGCIINIASIEALHPSSTKEQEKAQLKELTAFMACMVLGRMGEADDVARVALFLASDLASYMTGSLIVVDGGYLISQN